MRKSLTKSLARIVAVIGLAALTAGCFQPLYGERTNTSAPEGANIKEALSGVEIQKITAAPGSPEERIAVEVQNDLIFSLTGGGTPNYATHQVRIRISSTRTSVIVDVYTARPDVPVYPEGLGRPPLSDLKLLPADPEAQTADAPRFATWYGSLFD